MARLEETEFDVIVQGTGLMESVVAGAAARVGKKVLQIDEESSYGGNMSGLTLLQFDSWFDDQKHAGHYASKQLPTPSSSSSPSSSSETDADAAAADAEQSRPLETHFGFKKLASSQTIPDELKQEQKKYLLDLVPKYLMSNGPFVQLLVDSSISRYLSFKCPQASMLLLLADNDSPDSDSPSSLQSRSMKMTFHKVPCSKGDVFQDRLISLVEKRFLMKFLHFCLEFENSQSDLSTYQEFQDKPFVDLLHHFKLSPKLQDFVLYSIALLNSADRVSTKDALERVRLNLSSMGKFGNTPFLWPLFGLSEISQAFCRVGAIYGATYILRLGISSLLINPQTNECTGVVVSPANSAEDASPVLVQEQRLSCKHVVVSGGIVPRGDRLTVKSLIHRYLCITDSSLFSDSTQQIVFAAIPPKTAGEQQHNTAFLIQLDHTCFVSPKGKYVVHVSSEVLPHQVENAESVNCLDKCVRDLLDFGDDPASSSNETQPKPRVLYFCSYIQFIRQHETSSQPIPNLHFCSDPDNELHIEHVVEEAKKLFRKICPDENEAPFFPQLPNPEDAICVERDENTNAQQNSTVDSNMETTEPTTTESENQGSSDEKGLN